MLCGTTATPPGKHGQQAVPYKHRHTGIGATEARYLDGRRFTVSAALAGSRRCGLRARHQAPIPRCVFGTCAVRLETQASCESSVSPTLCLLARERLGRRGQVWASVGSSSVIMWPSGLRIAASCPYLVN